MSPAQAKSLVTGAKSLVTHSSQEATPVYGRIGYPSNDLTGFARGPVDHVAIVDGVQYRGRDAELIIEAALEMEKNLFDLAQSRIRALMERLCAGPLRVAPDGTLLPEEKARLLAEIRHYGVPAEDLRFDPSAKVLHLFPANMKVVAEEVIERTNPTPPRPGSS